MAGAFGIIPKSNHGWISCFGRDGSAACARKDERVQIVFLQSAVNSLGSGQPYILCSVRFVASAVGLEIHLVGDVQLRLAVLDGAGIGMSQVEFAKLGERFYRGRGAKRIQPLIEIALHSILKNHGAVRIFALGVFSARTGVPLQQIILWIGGNDACNFRGIDNYCALLFHRQNRIVHYFFLIGIEAVSRRFVAGAYESPGGVTAS